MNMTEMNVPIMAPIPTALAQDSFEINGFFIVITAFLYFDPVDYSKIHKNLCDHYVRIL